MAYHVEPILAAVGRRQSKYCLFIIKVVKDQSYPIHLCNVTLASFSL